MLFSEGETWVKTSGLFDITMGAYHGAEVCELVGLYILKMMKDKFPNINFGLYRDDGLGSHRRMPGPALERTKKEIVKEFKRIGLAITIETGMRQVDFLDVTLDLSNEVYKPYKKPNSNTMYVNAKSNHPPTVIKHLPESVNKRLNDISCNEEVFNAAKGEYEKALQDAGYNFTLTYEVTNEEEELRRKERNEKKKARRRKVIWYNPPWNAALKTNLGAKFLQLIKKHFNKRNPLSKIFNKNTVKIGYSCTANIGAIIQNHNNRILNPEETEEEDACNCRKRSCPLEGRCKSSKCVIYEATATSPSNVTRKYIGSTEGDFKTRYTGHVQSFTTESKKTSTTLSKFIWESNMSPEPNVKFKILRKATPYRPGKRMCDLCLSEKLEISKVSRKSEYLNTRDEIIRKCPHRDKFTLRRVKNN